MSHQKASVILYTRPGCHLCDEVKAQMLAAGCDDLYDLEEINIENDPELVERFGILIPVVAINGVDVFRYRVTAEAFKESVMKAQAGEVAQPD